MKEETAADHSVETSPPSESKIKMSIEERRTYLGGSDCANICALSRWGSPLKTWSEKTGILDPPDISKELPVRLGKKWEEDVAELFTEATGKKVRRVNETLFHSQYPFLGANIDRRVVGEDAILECKTTNQFNAKQWEGEEIPQEYILQVLHYLMVTGNKKAYIAVLIGNSDFKWKEVLRDEAVIKQILEKECRFWNDFVVPKIQPTVIRANDTDTLARLYPAAIEGTTIVLPDDINRDIEHLEAIKEDLKSLESQKERINNILKAAIKENEVGDTGIYKITYKSVHRAEYVVKETDYRTLRIKKIAKE
jgi:putative phage-type endonuclease